MQIKEYSFPSATGVCEIHGNVYTPDDGQVDAVLALHHGMAEHQERYRNFVEYLTSNHIAVYFSDMANHGASNQNFEHTGFFGDKDGYKELVHDFRTVFDMARNDYPDKRIVVMGHSMGSFIVRCFAAWFANECDYEKAIFMGTGGANPLAEIGNGLSSLISRTKGKYYKSKTLDSLTFGSYNSKFEGRTNFDWLTRDNDIVDKYINDKYCGFLFSAQGMNDLVKINIASNSKEWYDKLPKDRAYLVISGEMDPVGEYGKAVKGVYDKLIQTGHSKAELKLYPECRHEVLNELNKDEVYNDVKDFILK
ncbi:MAG: alpha/beta fold hydrolase [Eubacterium sp.]|nr:alpha/beta fold hydrolase [Eubacterium sp.]